MKSTSLTFEASTLTLAREIWLQAVVIALTEISVPLIRNGVAVRIWVDGQRIADSEDPTL
ncbi:hypothetical protein [Nocardia sp. NPDC057030]|uniref:hypothetical protein n=1 Tax=unclassified Nocardia TaxID=2637762 RepID=UPI003624B2A7